VIMHVEDPPGSARTRVTVHDHGGGFVPPAENSLNRYCFLLQVRPELLDEYRRRHAEVWPEMLRALAATGWHNYSIFARPDGLLVGYVEAIDLAAAQTAMAATEVNGRWQAEMSRFFIGLDGQPPDEGFLLLEPVFNLEQQLSGHPADPAQTAAAAPISTQGAE
jgi:L-rhamnose mutarotase